MKLCGGAIGRSDEIFLAIRVFLHKYMNKSTLPSMIFIACPDRGAGNDPETLGLDHSPLERLKQSTIRLWQ